MTSPFLGLALLLVAGVLVFVLWPLQRSRTRVPFAAAVGEQGSDVWEAGSEPLLARAALLARRDALYTALRDAEFDYAVGKLAADDYQKLHRQLTLEAARVLRELDHLTPELRAAHDEEIERAVARLRAGNEAMIASLPVEIREAVEAEIASLIKHSAACDTGGRTCPHCGRVYQPGDLFCMHCGAKLG